MLLNIARDRVGNEIGDRFALPPLVAEPRSTRHPSWEAAPSGAAALAIWGLTASAAPGRLAIASVTRSSSSRQSRQVCRLAYWSWPRIRNHSVARLGGDQLAHRVEREGRRRAGAARPRSSTKRGSPAIARRTIASRSAASARRRAFCHGWPTGIQRSSSSRELLERGRRQRDVSVVDRVEAAAEQADALHRPSPVVAVGPVARPQEVAVEPRLGRARLGPPVVAPGDDRRHRHQDALGAPARLQAEQRAAVVDQVELDVAAAAVGLEVALALAVGRCRGGAARSAGRPARKASPTARISAKLVSKPPSAKSSKNTPPMPRGSSRCLRKKYSSHQRLKRGYLSAPNGASASRLTTVEVDARPPRSRSRASGPCRRRTRPPARRRRAVAASMRTFMCTVGT